jgi:hypothetical protein
MFDSNDMHELAHIKAYRYARDGGGGAHKVYKTSKAYHDARGHNDMSPYRQAFYEAIARFRQSCQLAKMDFRAAGNDFDLMLCERRDADAYALANIPF